MPGDTDETDATTRALAHDLRVVVGRLVRRFREDGPLPMGQLSALGWLVRQGPRTTSQLAALERMRPQSMAHTVGELEAAGLVRRHPDPDDGRQTLIELTDDGATVMDGYFRTGEGWMGEAIATQLDAEERDVVARAVQLLTRIAGGS